MHVPSHAGTLPDGVDPIPVPDTKGEAEMLLILLEAGLYPRIQSKEAPEKGANPEQGAGGTN